MAKDWYAKNPAAFIDGTADMTLEMVGAYSLILDFIYLYDRPLRDNNSYIAGLLRCDVRKWKCIRDRLLSMGKLLEIEGGYLDNPRAIHERSERDRRGIEKRSAGHRGGIASGQARKNKDLGEAPASTNRTTYRHTDIQTDKEIDRGAKAPSPKRASEVPEDWQPKPETISSLKAKGHSDSVLVEQLERFRDHHRSKGNTFKDIDAAFKNWMAKSVEFARGGSPPKAAGGLGGALDRIVEKARRHDEPDCETGEVVDLSRHRVRG